MSRLFYYIFIKPLSLLPFRALYVLSDVIRFLMYNVIGYRKSVVYTNLRNAFPEKSDREIKDIASKFYAHLSDLIVESVKLFSITEEEAIKRHRIVNPEVIDRLYDEGKNCLIASGHYTNWEMLTASLNAQIKHRPVSIYTKLHDKFIDDKMLESRSRYGMKMISTRQVKRFLDNPGEELFALVFLSDQSPSSAKRSYWMKFLNQDTAVLYGAEKYAKEYNLPVLTGYFTRLKRGYYEVRLKVLFEKPQETAYGEITEVFTRELEKQIVKKPEYWLWSHRRWKRKRGEN